MTFITVHLKVSSNLVAHGSQLCDGGLILCWNRIRKFITQGEPTEKRHTEDRQTENSITEATLIPDGLSG